VSNPSKASKPTRWFGLFSRRERWGLSLRGWLLLLGGLITLTLTWLFNIQPFLAQTHRLDTRILVVEGWVHPFAIRAAVEEFKTGHYEQVYTTGGPVVGEGGYSNDFNTSASVGAELLIKAGLPADHVQMVPSQTSGRDRTYHSALALAAWLRQHGRGGCRVNVLTEDAHARRTKLLFEQALAGVAEVGIVSVPSPEYDAHRWWHYSEGVREVLSEWIAYLYARLLFRPETGAQP